MAEAKTKLNNASVAAYLKKIANTQVREDCGAIAAMMEDATKAPPKMWGAAIVGFDTRTIVYAGGREADWPVIAFSARKQNITLYLGGLEQQTDLLAKLGTHGCGKGCLYIKRLADVDVP